MSVGRSLARMLSAFLITSLAACGGASRLVDSPEALPDERRPLALNFVGVNSVDPRELERALDRVLNDFEASGYRPAYLDDAAYQLEAYLRELGFLSARAEAAWTPEAAGGRIEFQVNEGPRAVLESFEIRGATQFDVRELLALFDFPKGTWGQQLQTFYAPGAFADGRRRLEDRYAAEGYPDLTLREPWLFREADGSAVRLQLELSEGTAQRLAAIEFDLDPGEADAVSIQLLEASVRDLIGEPFTARLATRVRGRLLEAYANRGYPEATVVTPQRLDLETGAVTLRARILPGPLVRLGEIHTPEEVRSRRGFVLERLGLRSGDLYSEQALRSGFARLYRTGLYRTVQVDLASKPGGEQARLDPQNSGASDDPSSSVPRDLVVQLEEVPSRELYVEPGYGAFELARLRGGFRQRNLFGTGRGLRLEGLLAQRAVGAELGLSDPALFGTNVLGDASVSFEQRERPSFTRQESAFELSGTFARSRRFQLALEYTVGRTQVFDVAVDPAFDPTLAAALAGVDVASLTIAPSYDTRDRLFTPNRGIQSRFGLEWASSVLGSEIDFLRPTLSLSAFWPLDFLSEGTVFGATLQGGLIVPLGSAQEIPITERFFNGGAHTVRAFTQDDLGPKDGQGEPIGGRALQIASVELRQPLLGRLHGAAFYDLGNVRADHRDVFELDGLRGGPGIGLRYLLPVGPIRLDLGFNPDPGPGESEFVGHFSVGMAF